MRLSEIINTVINIIASRKGIDVERIDIGDSLEEFTIDKYELNNDKFEIKWAIEEKYKIVIPDDKFFSAKYVDDIVILVLGAIPFFEVKLDHVGKLKTKFYLDEQEDYFG